MLNELLSNFMIFFHELWRYDVYLTSFKILTLFQTWSHFYKCLQNLFNLTSQGASLEMIKLNSGRQWHKN